MYNESKSFSLVRIIVKIIIIVIFVMLAIWLISKVVNKTSNSAFEKNMNIMKNASIEYFKKGNLPEEEGDAKKVTLDDLIKMKYISSFDKKCDRDKSYSQATMVDDYYAVRVELLCGNRKEYIYTSIDKDGNCIGDNCTKEENKENKGNNEKKESKKDNNNDKKTDSSNKTDSNKIENDSSAKNNTNADSNNSGNDTSGKSNNGGKTLYYEHVRANRVYSDWTYSKLSGDNVETKKVNSTINKYCKILTSDFYVISYYSLNTALGNNYRTVVRLDSIPSNTSYYKLSVSELFNNNLSLYETALSESQKTTFVLGNNGYKVLDNALYLRYSSLKNDNVNIISNSMYSNNGLYVDTVVRLNNFGGVYKFKSNAYGYIYFVPIHYVVKYADEPSCVKDVSANSSKYSGYTSVSSESSTATLYRSYTYSKDESDKKWSTNKNIDGYILTGKTEYR